MPRSIPTLIYSVFSVDHRDHAGTITDKMQLAYAEELRTIDSAIAGCVGNKTGYQTEAAARRMMEHYVALRDLGYTHYVPSHVMNDTVRLCYQRASSGSYCAMHVEYNWNMGLRDTEVRLKLLRKVGVRVLLSRDGSAEQSAAYWRRNVSDGALRDPTEVHNALRDPAWKQRTAEVERVSTQGDTMASICVVLPNHERIALRTDGVA